MLSSCTHLDRETRNKGCKRQSQKDAFRLCVLRHILGKTWCCRFETRGLALGHGLPCHLPMYQSCGQDTFLFRILQAERLNSLTDTLQHARQSIAAPQKRMEARIVGEGRNGVTGKMGSSASGNRKQRRRPRGIGTAACFLDWFYRFTWVSTAFPDSGAARCAHLLPVFTEG